MDKMEQEKPSKKNNIKFWAVALLLGALLLFAVGGYPLFKQIALDTIGLEVTGTVVGVAGADRIRTPIVEFTAADGEQYTFKSHYGNRNIRFVIGEEVQMRYLAFNPQIAEINLLGRINYPSNLGATCIGSFLLMGGLVALRNKPLVLDFSKKE
jgi:cytochrome c oxidase assembly protein Cox11